jgi:protein-arginine kinase activator protein McsA
MLCGEEKVVFTAGDEDTKKVVTICEECAKKIGDIPTSDVIDKYGKVDESAFSGEGISIRGLDKLQAELKERKLKECEEKEESKEQK